jgi:hypothetical protein
MQICGIQINPMQNNGYQLVLPRFPVAQYFNTDFVLPQVSLPSATVATPFSDMPVAGDKPIFQPLVFSFLVDEGMNNYTEILDWINNIGFSGSYEDYVNYSNKEAPHQTLGEQDAKVIILSNKGNPIKTITFYDAIPVNLSSISYTTQDAGTSYVKATVTMAYTRFEFTN